MLELLWHRLCLLPAACRNRLLDVWYGWDRRAIALVGVVAVPLTVVGTLAQFAYSGHVRMLAEQQRQTDLRCLAENVYHEARGEPRDGQMAVAEVTLNRVASPRFPDSVCAVVYEKRLDVLRGRHVGAFSWTELEVRPPRGRAWENAQTAAVAVYDRRHIPLVPEALHYHASSITPIWSRSKRPLARIGNHVFYE